MSSCGRKIFADDWEQASHNGELVHAVEAGKLDRDGITELGAVLTGDSPGRESDDEITSFDSTGLAIQDLAIALAAMERPKSWTFRASRCRTRYGPLRRPWRCPRPHASG